MYCKIPLLALLLSTVVVIVVTQDDVHVASSRPRMDSVLTKCSSFLRTGGSIAPPDRRETLPLATVCHPNYDKFLDCISADIYKSTSKVDIQTRSVTDFPRAKAATETFCRDAKKLDEEARFCKVSLQECQSFSLRPKTMIKDSASFCSMKTDSRCAFDGFSNCSLKMAMIWSKYEREGTSIGCTLSDPKIQLIPSHGPELKCYSSINIDGIEPTDYGRIYERYCDHFNYTDVSSCVEKTLSNVTSEELLDDKASYINKARQFVDDRRTLCRKLKSLQSRKCLIPTYRPNVSMCQNMLFNPPGPSHYSDSTYITSYAHCLKLVYFPCNLHIGHLIYTNLLTFKER